MTSFGGGSSYIWCGLCFDGRTNLVVLINATMTPVKYRDMIVEQIVPFTGAIAERFHFIDDNARPRRAIIVSELLQFHSILRMS